MSYKFDIVRCTACGAVWFDPPNVCVHGTHMSDECRDCGREITERWPNRVPLPCGIVYERFGGVYAACDGSRVSFAAVDSDMFTALYPGYLG